jgi:hypothetical protein
MKSIAIALGTLLVVALISFVILAGVWKFWRKSTIARLSQVLAFLSLGNLLTGDWAIAIGGFVLYGAIWRFSYGKMNFAEKIDYETFFRRN